MENKPPFFKFVAIYDANADVTFETATRKPLSIMDILDNIFPPEYRDTPYTDEEHLQDWRAFISLCLLATRSYKHYCSTLADGSIPNLPRTSMSYEDSLNHIGCYPSVPKIPENWSRILTGASLYVGNRENATANSGKRPPRLMYLSGLLQLSKFSYFALHCVVVCRLDCGFESVFKALQRDENITTPTLGIIQSLYSLILTDKEAQWFLNGSSIENRLLFNIFPNFNLEHSVTLHHNAFAYVVGEHYISRELSSCIIKFSNTNYESLHIDKQLQDVHHSFKSMLSRKEPHLCILRGAVGSGKKMTIQYLSNKERKPILIVDLDKLFSKDGYSNSFIKIMDELLFLTFIEGVTLCISLKDPSSNSHIQYIFDMTKTYRLGIFLLTESTHYPTIQDGFIVNCIDYPQLDLKKSFDFWQLFSKDYEYSSEIDWMQIAARYTLTAGKIETTLRHANHMAKIKNSPITEDIISEVVLRENTKRLSAIADRINLVYTWDDLMLDDMRKKALVQACNRIKHRYTVEIEWGGRFAYGNGVSILLYGPPGTGKTMAAQVVAKDLGLPLYRIDLSRIVSKYVGETAKNINEIFEEAKNSNVILFFDEADALFAQRTEVKSSNDRHANSESSYLLQKIEDYSGVSILASNLSNTIDDAFRRRINYMINIHMPNEEQSLAIWKKCIPANAPISKDVSFEYLAKNTKFSGSVIKVAVIQAAYFAAEENLPISMKHFALAIILEARKLGMSEPDAFKRFLYY